MLERDLHEGEYVLEIDYNMELVSSHSLNRISNVLIRVATS